MLKKEDVIEALSKVMDPELHRSLTDLKMVRNVIVRNKAVEVTIALTIPNCPLKDQIEADVYAAIINLPEVEEVTVHMESMTDQERKAIFGEQRHDRQAANRTRGDRQYHMPEIIEQFHAKTQLTPAVGNKPA